MPKKTSTYGGFLENDPDEPRKGKRTGPSARKGHRSDSVRTCETCSGSGKKNGKTCPACHGDSGIDLKNL